MKLNLYNRNPTVGLALPFHIQCVKLRMLHQRTQSHIYFCNVYFYKNIIRKLIRIFFDTDC